MPFYHSSEPQSRVSFLYPGARVLVLETFEVSIDTSQHASLCPLKAFSGLDRPRENLKGLKQVLLHLYLST